MQSHRLPLPVCAHDQLGGGMTNFRLQIAAESNNPSPRPVVLKPESSAPGVGAVLVAEETTALEFTGPKVATSMNLFHIARSGI